MDALTIQGLCKRYPTFALRDVAFSLPQGSVMGLIGVNGAGKTTTLKAMMGYVHPDQGEVAVFGRPVEQMRGEIGFVSGAADYFPRKKLKTIAAVTRGFYPDWAEETYRRCLRRFRLDENKRVRELSAGMKVKFQLALALSHRARLLILDEPTSGLDPVSRDDLLELLLTLQEEDGVSILFSTHITSDLEKCATHITYLRGGEVVLSDEREAVLRRYRVASGETDDLNDALRAGLMGAKRHMGRFSGLILAQDAPHYAQFTLADATLEDIMIYLERGCGA